MLFSSPIFLFLFLPVTLGIYFLLRGQWRNRWLLVASLLFYIFGDGEYSLFLIGLIGANYWCGRWVAAFENEGSRRMAMLASIGLDVALLATFKYGNFAIDNLNTLREWFGLDRIQVAPIHLPLGISFVTFHCMSYIIDVYRRKTPAQRGGASFALYISFFPQAIAGPIVRYCDIAGQLESRQVTSQAFAEGIHRFVLGLGKKMLIANSMAIVADAAFNASFGQLSPGAAWLGLICYAFQIYFDFSGYSDMAVGLALMFGFRFIENFNYPYASTSITDFWRRWHISLSTWFRDYVYIPLGGNRCGPIRTYVNLLIVFLLCGLWHGASWNFVLWGVFHGVFLVAERLIWGEWLNRCWRPIQHVYTLFIILMGWVFFRVETLPQAFAYFQMLWGLAPLTENYAHFETFADRGLWIALVAAVIGSIPTLPWLQKMRIQIMTNSHGHPIVDPVSIFVMGFGRITVVLTILVASASLMLAGTYNPFIYFRF
jgi:alginate O-acetyltransferase complex protein AlgI